MSFAAVLALVALYEWLSERKREDLRDVSPLWWTLHRSFGLFMGAALTTLVASIAIAPFAVYHFHRMTHYGADRQSDRGAAREPLDHAHGRAQPDCHAPWSRGLATQGRWGSASS
jgi:Competence protein